MASAVINTTGWSHSGAGSGVVSFSPSGSSRGSSGSAITSLGSPTGIMSNPFNVSGARDLKEDKIYNDISTGKSVSNGINLSDINDLFSNFSNFANNSKSENLQNARDNAQLQYGMNAGLMRLQHKLNENSADKVMRYNAIESEKNRQFQERLSNTAHQREIEDLKLAGLNPVLSGLGGYGSSTPAGSEAQGYNAQTGLNGVSSIPLDLTNNAQILSSVFDNFLSNVVNERISNKRMSIDKIIADAKNDTAKKTTRLGSILNHSATILDNIGTDNESLEWLFGKDGMKYIQGSPFGRLIEHYKD